ncbi:MAG: NAD(P)(+) transhydrogenase (Re/Si-specific) subunit beta [Opitutaceae bacterium]
MHSLILINLSYIVASILFIFGLKMLGNAQTARRGNLISAIGMLIAVVVTLLDRQVLDFKWIAIGLIVGTVIGAPAAKLVKMTAMPEMVALFNGFGGLASLLVGWAEYQKIVSEGWAAYLFRNPTATVFFTSTVIVLAVLIGGITFTGSVYAYLKLSGRVSGRAKVFGGQKLLNLSVAVLIVAVGFLFVIRGEGHNVYPEFVGLVVLSLLLGLLAVMPIGGGDMPVVIAILNSLSGLAAAAAGFVIANNVLIVAGCLVGASGVILSIIMCKAMNRTIGNVLFSGFGASDAGSGGTAMEGELKPISAADTYYVLEAAQSVVIVPGYGMAVAQAQHVVKELGDLLESNGTEVRFAIHPVAGRMPGHMNVLLAEADVPYEQLVEMDNINPTMPSVDVAIVIGANDVVNPAATNDKASPIYGMPIINAHEAKTVICLKRGKGTGFSGLENQLFLLPQTRMLYGDAKSSIQGLVSEFKNA